MSGKSIFAEVQRQIRAAQREAERSKKAAEREYNAAVRQAGQARKAEERAVAQAERAAESDRKRLEREAKAAHVAAKQSEVEAKNAQLADIYEQIDGLLAATLDVDDYVDLDELRRTVEHPPFPRSDLEVAIPEPDNIPDPKEPEFVGPDPAKGLFGKKKRMADAQAQAEEAHESALTSWRSEVEALPARRKEIAEEHAKSESERIDNLATERTQYDEECRQRELEVNDHNQALDTLIANLGYGTADAIQEYVSIVLSNSVYPEHFEVSHSFDFDPATAELNLKALVPAPDSISTIKTYRYTKSKDEISTTALSQKASKDRYLGAVQQVALRSLHEVFEADRRGLIQTISLELGTETIDPATGNQTYIPFVAVAAERDAFIGFDLSAVLPGATLDRLGAAVSKNPFGLVAANTSGIRTA